MNVKLCALPFFRAQQTCGLQKYLRVCLGINALYNILKYINGRLPQNLQIDHPTGHSDRYTFISNAINSCVASDPSPSLLTCASVIVLLVKLSKSSLVFFFRLALPINCFCFVLFCFVLVKL
jgi:hypothetical protein